MVGSMLPPTALAGLRVLDLTTLLAAPQIAAMLGDFGADVVKVEPPTGDPLRQIGVRRGEGSPAWAWVSRNKRAITLDLDQPDGQRIFRRLAVEADVLVENLTPGAASSAGDATTRASLPTIRELVVVSVSCFGQTGPLAGEPGAGALAEAFAGFAHMNGESDGPPILPSLPLGDAMTGFSGVIGALLACYWRDRRDTGSGRGQHVDISMYEPILQLLGLPIATLLARRAGEGEGPRRNGSRVEGGVPRNLYRCRDGRFVALSAHDRRAGRAGARGDRPRSARGSRALRQVRRAPRGRRRARRARRELDRRTRPRPGARRLPRRSASPSPPSTTSPT